MRVILEPDELEQIKVLIDNIGLEKIDHIQIEENAISVEQREDASRILSKTQQKSSV